MGDTTIKLLGLTKVSLRVYNWYLYDIIQIHIYTGVEKRFKATEEVIKFRRRSSSFHL